ncbi:MAG TPA: SIR2 family protein [Blastocatellia bacterium]|nr:SIR2 family protein [Blastocatellia bacterium]
MDVGPSKKSSNWNAFFAAQRWDPDDFARLVEDDDIGAAAFEIETQINGMYRSALMAQEMASKFNLQIDLERQLDEMRFKAEWLSANFERFRKAIGPSQRELDLGLMRWMRRAACLSIVIGAGATMAAGGPSWAELVRQLLVLVTERGQEISEMRPTAESTPDHMELTRVVTDTKRLTPEDDQRARAILEKIASGDADTETLMQGAQLCYDFLGQHLFTDLTLILYEGDRKPSAIHEAIAELADPIQVIDRGGWFSGWDSIITYNFDDLMGEAVDQKGLARAAYAMRGAEMAGDPNERALKAGQRSLHQGIYHLHGYTPRRLFLITEVRFVFSTSQYEATYGSSRHGIVGEVFSRWLANPVHHALYVGCSFQDESMNALLRDASNVLPGRYHYALLKWPGSSKLMDSSPEDVALESVNYLVMGVRPIWFDDFDEIPELIRSLK